MHGHIARGQPGNIAVARGGQLPDVGPVGRFAGAAHQGGGEHKGQVAYRRHKAVVFVNADEIGFGAHGLGQGGDFADGAPAGFGAGNDAVGLAGEKGFLGVLRAGGFATRHGMAADEVHRAGQQFVGPLQHLAFGAAHIGNHAALGQIGGHTGHQVAHRQHGGGQDDDVGIVNGVAQPVFDPVERLPAGGAGAGAVFGVGADYGQVAQGGGPQRQPQRGANQPGAYDGNLCHRSTRPLRKKMRLVYIIKSGG